MSDLNKKILGTIEALRPIDGEHPHLFRMRSWAGEVRRASLLVVAMGVNSEGYREDAKEDKESASWRAVDHLRCLFGSAVEWAAKAFSSSSPLRRWPLLRKKPADGRSKSERAWRAHGGVGCENRAMLDPARLVFIGETSNTVMASRPLPARPSLDRPRSARSAPSWLHSARKNAQLLPTCRLRFHMTGIRSKIRIAPYCRRFLSARS